MRNTHIGLLVAGLAVAGGTAGIGASVAGAQPARAAPTVTHSTTNRGCDYEGDDSSTRCRRAQRSRPEPVRAAGCARPQLQPQLQLELDVGIHPQVHEYGLRLRLDEGGLIQLDVVHGVKRHGLLTRPEAGHPLRPGGGWPAPGARAG